MDNPKRYDDPNTYTISQLKSILAKEGVQQPTDRVTKAAYVELFNQHVASKYAGGNNGVSNSAGQNGNVAASTENSDMAVDTTTTTSASNTDSKKRKSMGQDEGAQSDNEVDAKRVKLTDVSIVSAISDTDYHPSQHNDSDTESVDTQNITLVTDTESSPIVVRRTTTTTTTTTTTPPVIQVAQRPSGQFVDATSFNNNRLSGFYTEPTLRTQSRLTSNFHVYQPAAVDDVNNTSEATIAPSTTNASPTGFISPTIIRYNHDEPTPRSTATSLGAQSQHARKGKWGQHFLLKLLSLIVGLVVFGLIYTTFVQRTAYQTPSGLPYCDTDMAGTIINIQEVEQSSTSRMVANEIHPREFDNIFNFFIGKKCQPCPMHGYCGFGNLVECSPGFFPRNSICMPVVDEKELSSATLEMLDILPAHLAAKAGLYQCCSLLDASRNNSSVLSVDSWVKQPFAYFVDKYVCPKCDMVAGPYEHQDELKAWFREKMQSKLGSKFSDLAFEQSFNNVIKMISESAPQLDIEVHANGQDQVKFRSTRPSFSYPCLALKFLVEHPGMIRLIAAAIVAVLVINTLFNRWHREAHRVQQLVSEVKQQLINSTEGIPIHHLRNSLKDRHGDHVDNVWPKVESSIASDNRIDKETNEDSVPVWKWAATERILSFSPN